MAISGNCVLSIISENLLILIGLLRLSYYVSLYFNDILSGLQKRDKAGSKEEEEGEPLFIGIHVRRTDYSSWLAGWKGVSVAFLDQTFFIEAAQFMREKIAQRNNDNNNNKKQQRVS